MNEDEKVYVVVSPDMEEEISKTVLYDALIVCTFMKPNTVVAVKCVDFDRMIDNGTRFERREEQK